METTDTQRPWHIGDEVYGADDQKLGKIVALDPNFLTVEHGLIRKGQLYIPTTEVNNYADGNVYLKVNRDDASHQGWDTPPAVATDAGGRPVGEIQS